MRRIVVVDYDPEWPRQFETLRSLLLETVRELAVSIEHVGSTSVPGLAAKPVIDLDIVVSEENVAPVIGRLATIGYEHRGDLGIAQREAFKNPAGSIAHNLYVCPTGSPALANHIAVRDYLHEHPDSAREYGDLKRRLAREHSDDIDGYIEGKNGFLLAILREMGLASDRLSEIERMNRRPSG